MNPIYRLAAALLLLAAAPALAKSETRVRTDEGDVTVYERSVALLIGNSNYNKTPAWGRLPSIRQEVGVLGDALRAEGIEIVTKLDLTSKTLSSTLKNFLLQAHAPRTRLLVFFAGHGWTDRSYTGYIVPVDAPDVSDVSFRNMLTSMSEIKSWADDSDANHIMFLFDSCFSGTVFLSRRNLRPPSLFVRSALRRTRQFITSGNENEVVPAVSEFVPALVRGLQGEADIVKDGIITGNELGYWLFATLTRSGKQTPQFGSVVPGNDLPGDVVFTYGSKSSAPLATTKIAKASPPRTQSGKEKMVRGIGEPDSEDAKIFTGIDIVYYQKAGDGRSVIDPLSKAGIPFRATRAQLPESFKTNAIACGPDTPVEVLKALATKMLEASIPLRAIFKFNNPERKPNRFEILGISADAEGRVELATPLLTRAQIDKLSACPDMLTN